jgi:transketolase
VIIAHTVKGKGVSFMENSNSWHGKAASPEQAAEALAEIRS